MAGTGAGATGTVNFRPGVKPFIANITNSDWGSTPSDSMPSPSDMYGGLYDGINNPVATLLAESAAMNTLNDMLGLNANLDAEFIDSLGEIYPALTPVEIAAVLNTYIDDRYGTGPGKGGLFPNGIPNPVTGKTGWTDYKLLDPFSHPDLHSLLLDVSLDKPAGFPNYSALTTDPQTVNLPEIFGEEGGPPKGYTDGFVSYSTLSNGNTLVVQMIPVGAGLEEYRTYTVTPTGLILSSSGFLNNPNKAIEHREHPIPIPEELRVQPPNTTEENTPTNTDEGGGDDTAATTKAPITYGGSKTGAVTGSTGNKTGTVGGYKDPYIAGFDDGNGGATIPIILDLDGDGVEVAFGEDIYFDLDDDGFLEKTSWASADDGFLVLDRNADGTRGAGDGVIDQSNELVLSSLGLEGDTDLQALARYDDNNDDKLDANDAIWTELKVWQDLNQDGKTEGDGTELKTLAAWGISSINLAYDDGTKCDDAVPSLMFTSKNKQGISYA